MQSPILSEIRTPVPAHELYQKAKRIIFMKLLWAPCIWECYEHPMTMLWAPCICRAEKSAEAFREQKFNKVCVPEVFNQLWPIFFHFWEVICPFTMDCSSSGQVKNGFFSHFNQEQNFVKYNFALEVLFCSWVIISYNLATFYVNCVRKSWKSNHVCIKLN